MMGYGHTSEKTDGAGPMTILLVALHVTLLKLLEMALKLEFACEILAFVGGKGSLETAETVTPDLVIIHAHLLDLDALELADRLHDRKGFESVPMLLTHMPFASEKTVLRPYLTILRLPFNLEAFYTAVHTCLDRA